MNYKSIERKLNNATTILDDIRISFYQIFNAKKFNSTMQETLQRMLNIDLPQADITRARHLGDKGAEFVLSGTGCAYAIRIFANTNAQVVVKIECVKSDKGDRAFLPIIKTFESYDRKNALKFYTTLKNNTNAQKVRAAFI